MAIVKKCKRKGTQPANGRKLRDLMDAKPWTIEDIMSKVPASRDTVESLLRGECAFPSTFQKFATLFKIDSSQLVVPPAPEEPDSTTTASPNQMPSPALPAPLASHDTVTVTVARGDVVITVSIPFDRFNECEHLPELVHNLATSLPGNDGINPKDVREGSTVVTLDMSNRDTLRLMELFHRHDVERFGIIGVDFITPNTPETSLPSQTGEPAPAASETKGTISITKPTLASLDINLGLVSNPQPATAGKDKSRHKKTEDKKTEDKKPEGKYKPLSSADLALFRLEHPPHSWPDSPMSRLAVALIPQLRYHSDPDARANAAIALGAIGLHTRQMIPALIRATADHDGYVAGCAA